MSAVPGPDQALALLAQGPLGHGAEREDGVVVAEQRHASAPGAFDRRVHVQASG